MSHSAVLRPWAQHAVNQVAGGRQPLGLRAPEATMVLVYTSSQLLFTRSSSTEKLRAGGRAAGGGGAAELGASTARLDADRN